LVDTIARLEAGIGFSEDDVEVPANEFIVNEVLSVRAELVNLQESFGYGKILSKGLRLAILGKPKVGKSSLFNRLVCADRAIVTDVPGTTRDALMETVNFAGVPLSFADTAGIRETKDQVEAIGVTRTFETLSESDFAIVVLDGSAPLDIEDDRVLSKTASIPHLVVVNKSDLPQKLDVSFLNGANRVLVSAQTGAGLDALHHALEEFIFFRRTSSADEA